MRKICYLLALSWLFGGVAACGSPPAPPLGQSLVRFPEDAFPIPADNQPTPERIELGRLLFFDPVLSVNQNVACASCHLPERAMADGRAVGAALSAPSGGDLPRSAPTIFNVRFQHSQFWDGRAGSLEQLALMPVENPLEMGNTIAGALAAVGAVPEYQTRFKSVYGEFSESALRRAIASFLRSVTANEAPVDRYLAGDSSALSADAAAGFDLYFGKARCSRCHYIPLFAGTEGPGFVSTEFRVTGVPERGQRVVTADRGRAMIEPVPQFERAFKAPTLRNIEKTAPYMHNGALTTLEEVIDFYDKGGGPGLGYAVQNLDFVLLPGPIGLSSSEKMKLLVFLREGLTDLTRTPQTPTSVPSGRTPGGVPAPL